MPGTDRPDPAAWLQSAAMREKLRQKGLELLAKPKGLDPEGLRWAEHWAGMKPLVVPLSVGLAPVAPRDTLVRRKPSAPADLPATEAVGTTAARLRVNAASMSRFICSRSIILAFLSQRLGAVGGVPLLDGCGLLGGEPCVLDGG